MSSRDWIMENLMAMDNVASADPIGRDFIRIIRANKPSFIAAVMYKDLITVDELNHLLQKKEPDFMVNIPKNAPWTGDAISLMKEWGIGWGGVKELMSAIGVNDVRNFQKKEYTFVIDGLLQHDQVNDLTRHYDRLIEIHRYSYSSLKIVILNEYELTAECVREAKKKYDDFSIILRTNPNGGFTENASQIAENLGAEVLNWSSLFARLNKE